MRARGTLAVLAVVAAIAGTTGATLAAFSSTTGNAGSTFATAASFSTCPNQSITAAYLTGFEMGRRPYNAQSLSVFNPGTVDAAIKRTGGYSMKLAPSASVVYAQWWNPVTTSPTQIVRFALHLDALPAGDVSQLLHMNSPGGLKLRYTAATKKLSVAIAATSGGTPAVATSDVVMQAARWYVIEIRYRVAAPTHIADWRIDGSPQPSASIAAAGTTTYTTTFGNNNAGETYSAHFDDIVISADSSVYPLGDGRIYGLHPNGMGTSVPGGVIKDDDGTDVDAASWQRLDELPMAVTTDFIQQTAVSSTAYAEIAMQDTSHTCIRAAHGYYTTHSGTTTKDNHAKIVVRDGTKESVLLNGSTLAGGSSGPTTPRDGSAPITPASTWSQSVLNGLVVRFGFSTNVTFEGPKLDGLLVEYEVPQ